MRSYFVIFLVLLVSKHVTYSNKTDLIMVKNKSPAPEGAESSQHTNANDASIIKSSTIEVPSDANVASTTYRSVRQNTSQERDTKLMSLLAARRSALTQDRFRTHRRIVTTGRTRFSVEATSKSPPDSKTTCVRNCTKNFTRRTTARCMRQCASIQKQPANTTSEEEKSQKDNNEILFTDESNVGFFVVAKEINDTANHIPEMKKIVPPTVGNAYKTRQRSKPRSSEAPAFFSKKVPSLRPSFLSISSVSDEHPQLLEVSVSQKTEKPKPTNKFTPNTRLRQSAGFIRKLSSSSISPIAVSETVTNIHLENTTTADIVEVSSASSTAGETEPTATTNEITTLTLEDTTLPTSTEGNSDSEEFTETVQTEPSTPLIITVEDYEETTDAQELEVPTNTNHDINVNEELLKNAPQQEEGTNLIIFLNKTSDAISTPAMLPALSSAPSQSSANSSTNGLTIVKTTVLTSVRSTVHPPLEVGNRNQNNSSELPSSTTPSEEEVADPMPTESESNRQNLAIYVMASLGTIPALIIIVYLTRLIILRGYSKHHEDFDGCFTDQQPISPVQKTDKYQEDDDSCKYEQCSISSLEEFNRSNLRLKSLLGEGNFGQVWKAEADDLRGHIGATRIVAVKTVRSGGAQDGLKDEATIMRKLGSHPNVVTLLGACIETEPHMLIMEFAMRGRLLSLLRAARSATNILPASVPGGRSLAPLSPRTLAGFALDIATGMEYIAEKRVVHRDLAARNVLIDHNGVCKICDFGMSIDLDTIRKKRDKQAALNLMSRHSSKFDKIKIDIGERFINHLHNGLSSPKKGHDSLGRRPALPIRWMAPESLQYNEFTTKTDVWAFGIVLWEIATLGATPYANLTGREVVRQVLQGTRPELPKDNRHGFFELMSQCWHRIPELRPTFEEARLEISRFVRKWIDDDASTSDYMDVSGFSEDMEHGMVYFNQRISEFECEI